jgi:hypothetical protein
VVQQPTRVGPPVVNADPAHSSGNFTTEVPIVPAY